MAKRRRFKLDPRISEELKGQRRPITKGLIATFIGSTVYGYSISATTDAMSNMENLARHRLQVDFDHLKLNCLIIFGVFVIRYFAIRAQTIYLSEAVTRLTNGLRVKLMRKLLRLPVTYYNDKKSGAIQSILNNDVNVFQSAVQILRDSVEAPVKATVALITIFILQWQMALVTLVMIPIIGVIVHQNGKKMRKAQKVAQSDLAHVGSVTQETLQGIRVIKSFGAEDQMVQSYLGTTNQSVKSQLQTAMIVAKLKPLVELLGAVGLIGAILIGGYLAMTGKMSVSKIVGLMFALDTINQGFRGLSSLSSTYASVQAAADRIYSEVLDVPEPPEASGHKILQRVDGHIQFENVSFSYPDGTLALQNVSFEIHPGESVALVGPSGAGKSTLADLLLRFYEPMTGRITLDGVDIRELDSSWLRGQIGVVPQQTFLFAGGIDDNLRLGTPDATDAQLEKALVMAHAKDFTEEFRERNVPVLGERGVKLSGGQMQRIAIARALVRDPHILLLDEATSALDAASETAVTNALQEVMATRSTLFIAHRLTTAARATRIVLLKKGQVVEQGAHKELLDRNGEYAALFRLFNAGVINDDLG